MAAAATTTSIIRGGGLPGRLLLEQPGLVVFIFQLSNPFLVLLQCAIEFVPLPLRRRHASFGCRSGSVRVW